MSKSEKEVVVREFPRWGYPPDGGKGKVIASPDEWPDGWVDQPSGTALSAGGERLIGQRAEHPVPPTGDTGDVAHVAASVVEESPATKKSKK